MRGRGGGQGAVGPRLVVRDVVPVLGSVRCVIDGLCCSSSSVRFAKNSEGEKKQAKDSERKGPSDEPEFDGVLFLLRALDRPGGVYFAGQP